MQTSIIKPELHHTSKAIFCNTLVTSMHADDSTSMKSNLREDVFDVVCYTARVGVHGVVKSQMLSMAGT